MLQQVDECRNFIRGKSKLGTRKNIGIFLEHSGRKASPHESLLDSEKQQGFIARGRDQGRYEDIRINDRPNHFFFSRLYALISPSISWEVSLSSPRRFALAQDFSSHFGGGAMVLMKSLTLMMTTAGSSAPVYDKALIVRQER
jgi:hypothetical protein